jgi:hypothetical protein
MQRDKKKKDKPKRGVPLEDQLDQLADGAAGGAPGRGADNPLKIPNSTQPKGPAAGPKGARPQSPPPSRRTLTTPEGGNGGLGAGVAGGFGALHMDTVGFEDKPVPVVADEHGVESRGSPSDAPPRLTAAAKEFVPGMAWASAGAHLGQFSIPLFMDRTALSSTVFMYCTVLSSTVFLFLPGLRLS